MNSILEDHNFTSPKLPASVVFFPKGVKGSRKKRHRHHPVDFLVGGFSPFEKYARQNGSLPQIGVKINNL